MRKIGKYMILLIKRILKYTHKRPVKCKSKKKAASVKIGIIRKITSHDYKFDSQENNWKNNIQNNAQDIIQLYRDNQVIFQYNRMQTVSNHPEMKYKDTIRAGKFQLKCFVDKRAFQNLVHGIINAYDLDGQKIDEYSMQLENGYQKGRWLVHDNFSKKKNRDLKNCYSGGCFMFLQSDVMKEFNSILMKNGIGMNDIIDGELYEW